MFLILMVLSIVATMIFGSVLIRLAFKIGAVDKADVPRKRHVGDIPFLGGISIFVVWLAMQTVIDSQSMFIIDKSSNFNSIWFFMPFVGIFLIGLFDDFRDVPPSTRLFLQSMIVLFLSKHLLQMKFPSTEKLIIQLILVFCCAIWLLSVCNAMNFIDNHDGVAGTVSFTSLAAISTLFIIKNEVYLGISAATLAVCIIGFLFWNRFPAKLYLGDNGALFLGLAVGYFSIIAAIDPSNLLRSLCSLMLLTYLPLLDITFVVISRILKRRSIFQAGRDHIAHILMETGLTPSKVWNSISIFHLFGVIWGVKMVAAPSPVDFIISCVLVIVWIATLFVLIQIQKNLGTLKAFD